MQYLNKVMVLKEIRTGYSNKGRGLSGIVRIQQEKGAYILNLSLINLKMVSNGEYVLCLMDEKKQFFTFNLGTYPTMFSCELPKSLYLDGNLHVGVAFDDGTSLFLVAHANDQNAQIKIAGFITAVENYTPKCQDAKQELLNATQKPCDCNYDDEVVATENYYLIDQSIDEKLKVIQGLENAGVQYENESFSNRSQEKKKKNQNEFAGASNETNANSRQNYSWQNPYFLHVKKELDQMFFKFPKEEVLERTVENSKWVKINYDKDKFYVVGLVYEDDQEKYICYGVPSRYSKTPPKELAGFCSFVPLSIFDMKGDGYWMMFQDAISGECVKKNKGN